MNIIVNGGTRGIGKEIVQILARGKQNNILVNGRNRDSLVRLSNKAVNGNVVGIDADMSRFDKNEKKFRDAVFSHFEHVDILINNAGLLISKDFCDFSGKDARDMMETNFFGPASVIRVVHPLMKTGSHIVNISSMGGFQGSSKYRGLSYYSASKAALSCLSESLAGEFREEGIIVNCLALGAVQTEMLEEAFPGYKAPVTAKEMAEFIADFAMTGSRFFNGKVIPVAVSNP